MKTVKFEVKKDVKASRLELLIRIFWSIPSLVVLVILSILGKIAWVIQVLHIAIYGKRHRALNKLIWVMMDYCVKWSAYIALLTDERNPILPKW